jgi:hypothetical protein
MKINLGKILIFMTLSLNAQDIAYNFHINNKTPYQKEAIILDVNISQLNHSNVMFFKFNPKESENYIFKQIDFREDEKYHNLSQHYRYIIYPIKNGKVAIKFDMIKSVTTDESVAYAISGDRDNIKTIDTKDTKVEIKPIILNVKALPKGIDLVGNFRLKYNIDKIETKSYEPIYLHIELRGDGFLESFEILPKNEKYHIFSQKPKVTDNSIVWDYAISSNSSFKIPKITLKAFDPKTEKNYTLKIPSQNIKVHQIDPKTLLDKRDNLPSSKDIDFSWIGWLVSYIVVFLSGFFMPKDILKRFKKDKSFEEKIKNIKDKKELLKLLILKDRDKYIETIKKLEEEIYEKHHR